MGVHSIGPAQFSSQMEASKRVRVLKPETGNTLVVLEENDDEALGLRRRSLSLTDQKGHCKDGN